jgi:hypothetical protein
MVDQISKARVFVSSDQLSKRAGAAFWPAGKTTS